jgi:hypothetical protein
MKNQIEITNEKEKRNYGVVEVKLVFYTLGAAYSP